MSRRGRFAGLALLLLLPLTAVADNPVAYRVGPGVQMTCGASAPARVSTRGMLWCDSADSNKLHYTDASGSDAAVGGGGGGVTWPLTNGTSPNSYTYGGTQSGSTSDHIFRATNALTAGDKMCSFGGTSELAFLGVPVATNIPELRSAGDNICMRNSSGTGFCTVGANDWYLYGTNTSNWHGLSNSYIEPTTDNAYALGTTTTRISNVHAALLSEESASVSGQQAGISMLATTAAVSSGTQSNSPGAVWQSQAWNTSSGAQTILWLAQAIPNAAANPVSGQWSLYNNDQGAGYNERFRVSDTGSAVAINNLSAGTGGTLSAFAAHFQPNTASTAADVCASNCASLAVGASSVVTTLKGSVVFATQSATMGSSVTITPGSGGTVKLTYTSATNVTTATLNTGTDGQHITIALIQPASGTAATMATTWTNVNFAGGTGSFTATLGKRDTYRFWYDGSTSKWYEISRSLNETN